MRIDDHQPCAHGKTNERHERVLKANPIEVDSPELQHVPHRRMGRQESLQGFLRIATLGRSHLCECLESHAHGWLHAFDEPSRKQPGHDPLWGAFSCCAGILHRCLESLAIDPVDARQMIEALPYAPGALIRLPVCLLTGLRAKQAFCGVLGLLQLFENGIAVCGKIRHVSLPPVWILWGCASISRWQSRRQFPAQRRADPLPSVSVARQ